MSFFSNLSSLLSANNSAFLSQVLAGAGLGLVTYAGFDQFSDYYLDKLLDTNFGTVTALAGLAGVDVMFSTIIGATAASVYIKTFATGLRVVKL